MLKRLFLTAVVLLSFFSIANQAYAAQSSEELEQLIQARQDQFEEIKSTFKQLRFEVVVNRNFDEKKATQYAKKLVELNKPLLGMFKERSDQGGTKASSQIWQKWPDFVKQMDRYQVASQNVLEPLRYANREDAAMYVNQAAKSCKGCHRLYKKR